MYEELHKYHYYRCSRITIKYSGTTARHFMRNAVSRAMPAVTADDSLSPRISPEDIRSFPSLGEQQPLNRRESSAVISASPYKNLLIQQKKAREQREAKKLTAANATQPKNRIAAPKRKLQLSDD